MRTIKILTLLIVFLLCSVPNTPAFLEDHDKSSEDSDLVQEAIHKRAYRETVEERKRKSKEAMPAREKRKAALTPFVNDTPQESADLPQRERITKEKNSPQKDLLKKAILPAAGADPSRELAKSMLVNFLVIIACFIGIIIASKYFRPKK